MKERVNEEIEKVFRPEFLNRVNDVIVFRHLKSNDLKEVIDLELGKVRERLSPRARPEARLDRRSEGLLDRKGNRTPTSVPARCAAPSRVSSRIRWPRNCSGANSRART